jgi:hypothetical protein
MLRNLFAPRTDSPFADLREARRLIAELPGGDPIRSLEELAHWLGATRAEGFRLEHRANIALLLDEAGQAAARRVAREYVAAARLSKIQENRWWNAVYEFWREVGLSHFDCLQAADAAAKPSEIPKQSLPLLGVRALRALTLQMKWLHIRYGPLDQSLWGMAGRIYAIAERRRITRVRSAVYPGLAGESTPEQELVRMVLFSVSSPDSLLPQEIDAGERIIGALATRVQVSTVPPPEATHWIDLAAGTPPLRHARPPENAGTVRYVAAGPAAAHANDILDAMGDKMGVPAALGLADAYSTELVRHVLEHLVRHWAPRLPERRHERHRVKARVTIAPGFDAALEVLQPGVSLAFTGARNESWIVENVSAGGFGARLPQAPSDWLRIEGLVALQPEGGSNWLLGIVRRLSRPGPNETAVGIQTLSRVPHVVNLRLRVGETLSLDVEMGILLAPLGADDRSVQLLVKSGVHALGQSFLLDQEGRTFTLLPREVSARGGDYEMIDCLVAVREPS